MSYQVWARHCRSPTNQMVFETNVPTLNDMINSTFGRLSIGMQYSNEGADEPWRITSGLFR